MTTDFKIDSSRLQRLLDPTRFPSLDAVGIEGSRLEIDGNPEQVFAGTIRLLEEVKGGVFSTAGFFGMGRNVSLHTDRAVGGSIRLVTPSNRRQSELRRGMISVLINGPLEGSFELLDEATGHGSLSVEVKRRVEVDIVVKTADETGVGRVQVEIHGDSPQMVTVLGLPAECTLSDPREPGGRKILLIKISSSLTDEARYMVANEHIEHEMRKFDDRR